MSDLLDRCKKYGVETGSRVICPNAKHKTFTDYDFVMTNRDFYRAFNDAQIDVFENSDSSGTSVRTQLDTQEGMKATFGSDTIDIIIVKDIADKKYWKETTQICRHINEVYPLDIKQDRIDMFENILGFLKSRIYEEGMF